MSILFDYFSLFLLPVLAFLLIRFGKTIHKNEYRIYLIVLMIALIASVFSALTVAGVIDIVGIILIYDILFSGHLSFSLYTILMFTGAFQNKSPAKIKLMRVRREMAILGFIFLLPHAILRFTMAVGGTALINFTGVIAVIIMIPLIVTSFPVVRKKIHPKKWKKIHLSAYVVYGAIFIHLAFNLIVVNGNWIINIKPTGWPYIILFFIYLALKCENYLFSTYFKAPPTKT